MVLQNDTTFASFLVQNFPNAINTAAFPDSVLRPGHTYQNICVWRLGTLPRQNRVQKLLMGLGLILAIAASVAGYMRYHGTTTRHRWRGPYYTKA